MYAASTLTMNGPTYLGSPEGEKVPDQVYLSAGFPDVRVHCQDF